MRRFVAAVLLFAGTAFAQDVIEPIEPDQLLSIPHILKTPVISDFAVAPNGETVALSLSALGKQTIWVLPGDETAGAPIATTRGAGERDVDFAPDGEHIVFVATRGRAWNVFVSNVDGKKARQITRHRGRDRKPRWSPDGSRIAYLSKRIGSETGWDLWVTAASGGPAKRLTEHPLDEDDFRWSPDGRRIALTYGAGKAGIVAVEGGGISSLLPEDWTGNSFSPRWSPDGSRIVFVSDAPGRKALYIVSSEGGTPELLLGSDYELTEPAWSPDGSSLAYVENREGNKRLKLYDFTRKKERTLTLRAGVHSQPVWRPDGSAVLSLFEAWNYPRDVWAYPIEGGRERVSDTLPPDLDVRRMARPELLRFETGDGLEVQGYLYLPEGASAEAPVPLLVRPHDGPTSQWTNGWHPFTQLLVQRGYAVLAPNVRGSTGYGLAFEKANDGAWGRGDLDDLAAFAQLLTDRPEVRNDRLAIWGVGYGGFLSLAAITRYPELFTCAVEAVGMPDLEKLYRETTDEGRSWLERELGPLRGNLALYRELSPVRDVGAVQTPLLSFHGVDYPLVPYETKRPFFDALRTRPDYPLIELVFRDDLVVGTYRHDLEPEAAWAYIDKVLEFLEIYL